MKIRSQKARQESQIQCQLFCATMTACFLCGKIVPSRSSCYRSPKISVQNPSLSCTDLKPSNYNSRSLTWNRSIFILSLKSKERVRKISLELYRVKFLIVTKHFHVVGRYLAAALLAQAQFRLVCHVVECKVLEDVRKQLGILHF